MSRPLVLSALLLLGFAAILAATLSRGGEERENASLPESVRIEGSAGPLSLHPEAGRVEFTDPEAARPLVEAPPRIEIPPLADRELKLETVEDLSEEAANRFIELADLFRRRDYTAARAYFSPGFAGHSPAPLPIRSRLDEPAGVVRTVWDPSGAPICDRRGFLESVKGLLAPFTRLDYVLLKTKAAEFERTRPRGVLRIFFKFLGPAETGALRSISGWAEAEVRRVQGEWVLHRFLLDSMETLERARPVFREISASAGVANEAGRFGERGLVGSFYWSGAAVADYDGDGLDDIFVPSLPANYLYRNRGDGTFENRAEAAGVAEPGGGTGCLFFDYDNDGDLDLFVAHVGWLEDGVPYGGSLRLYRNEGRSFRDVTRQAGLEYYTAAFSVAAADIEGDGDLDLYVTCYNRLDAVYPDSWYRATNGEPNLLFRNRGDGTFEEVARAAGVADSRWSYAAAFADYDEDGDQDLYVANDYGDNALFRNRGDGTFEDVAAEAGVLDTGNGMAVAWGDADNDGDLDLYVANMSSTAGNRILKRLVAREGGGELGRVLLKLAAGNSLFLQENGKFRLNPPEYGGVNASWAWSSAWLDIDLDSRLDLFVANGFISGASPKDT